MNQKIRDLFEQVTVPNFFVGEVDLSRNNRGEYINSTLEDHWQTFQEAAEAVIRECISIADQCREDEWFDVSGAIKEYMLND